jgi:hypothetical protein
MPVAIFKQINGLPKYNRAHSLHNCPSWALRELGFAKNDGDGWWRAAWTDRPWRPVWTGYTPEQRRLIRSGYKPVPVSHKELV